MSSPGSRVDLHLLTHTHTHTHIVHTSVSIQTQHWTVSKQTGNKNTFAAIKRSLRLLLPIRSSYCFCSVLTVRFIHWLDGWSSALQLQSVSQSVSRTNAPALLASGLCSSAMQQRLHTHTHSQHTQIHKRTHTHTFPSPSFSPLSVSLCSSAEFTYLPA